MTTISKGTCSICGFTKLYCLKVGLIAVCDGCLDVAKNDITKAKKKRFEIEILQGMGIESLDVCCLIDNAEGCERSIIGLDLKYKSQLIKIADLLNYFDKKLKNDK